MLEWDQPGQRKPREISHGAHSHPDSNDPGALPKTLTLRLVFLQMSHCLRRRQPPDPGLQMGAARTSLLARVRTSPGPQALAACWHLVGQWLTLQYTVVGRDFRLSIQPLNFGGLLLAQAMPLCEL
ncbi:hypothetical protein HJG60_009754 [Phyllostomus discolor]|uniref:Uncharacterized protein n=1 Tax=Phyllostomus discolor TaxID=89673 RepID=A0A834B9X6_9CHIR|nr:hypothetical protein HJG60_009754 [Phyllostomus discolor]